VDGEKKGEWAAMYLYLYLLLQMCVNVSHRLLVVVDLLD